MLQESQFMLFLFFVKLPFYLSYTAHTLKVANCFVCFYLRMRRQLRTP